MSPICLQIVFKLFFWAQYTQKYITSEQEGNTSHTIGVTYSTYYPFIFHAGINPVTPVSNKIDTTETKSGTINQFVADYKLNKNTTAFGQIVMYGENSTGNEVSYNVIGFGLRGKF